MDDVDRVVLGVMGAVSPFPRPELPGAQADGRHLLATHFYISHRIGALSGTAPASRWSRAPAQPAWAPRWKRAASTASRSTSSFIGSPECPFTQVNLISSPPGVDDLVDERSPQVLVRDRLAPGVPPPPGAPSRPPSLAEAVDDVGGVAHDVHVAADRAERLENGGHLHALIGRLLLVPALVLAPWRPPTPIRPGPGLPTHAPSVNTTVAGSGSSNSVTGSFCPVRRAGCSPRGLPAPSWPRLQ